MGDLSTLLAVIFLCLVSVAFGSVFLPQNEIKNTDKTGKEGAKKKLPEKAKRDKGADEYITKYSKLEKVFQKFCLSFNAELIFHNEFHLYFKDSSKKAQIKIVFYIHPSGVFNVYAVQHQSVFKEMILEENFDVLTGIDFEIFRNHINKQLLVAKKQIVKHG